MDEPLVEVSETLSAFRNSTEKVFNVNKGRTFLMNISLRDTDNKEFIIEKGGFLKLMEIKHLRKSSLKTSSISDLSALSTVKKEEVVFEVMNGHEGDKYIALSRDGVLFTSKGTSPNEYKFRVKVLKSFLEVGDHVDFIFSVKRFKNVQNQLFIKRLLIVDGELTVPNSLLFPSEVPENKIEKGCNLDLELTLENDASSPSDSMIAKAGFVKLMALKVEGEQVAFKAIDGSGEPSLLIPKEGIVLTKLENKTGNKYKFKIQAGSAVVEGKKIFLVFSIKRDNETPVMTFEKKVNILKKSPVFSIENSMITRTKIPSHEVMENCIVNEIFTLKNDASTAFDISKSGGTVKLKSVSFTNLNPPQKSVVLKIAIEHVKNAISTSAVLPIHLIKSGVSDYKFSIQPLSQIPKNAIINFTFEVTERVGQKVIEIVKTVSVLESVNAKNSISDKNSVLDRNSVSTYEIWANKILHLKLTLKDQDPSSIPIEIKSGGTVKLKSATAGSADLKVLNIADGHSNPSTGTPVILTKVEGTVSDYKFSIKSNSDIVKSKKNITCVFEIVPGMGKEPFHIIKEIAIENGINKTKTKLDKSSIQRHSVFSDNILHQTLTLKDDDNANFTDIVAVKLMKVVSSKVKFHVADGHLSPTTEIPNQANSGITLAKDSNNTGVYKFSIKPTSDVTITRITCGFEFELKDGKKVSFDKKIMIKNGGISKEKSTLNAPKSSEVKNGSSFKQTLKLKNNDNSDLKLGGAKVEIKLVTVESKVKLKSKSKVKSKSDTNFNIAADHSTSPVKTKAPIFLKEDPSEIGKYKFSIQSDADLDKDDIIIYTFDITPEGEATPIKFIKTVTVAYEISKINRDLKTNIASTRIWKDKALDLNFTLKNEDRITPIDFTKKAFDYKFRVHPMATVST